MSEQKIIWKGKRTLVCDDNGVLSFYVLQKDPAGNDYFQYQGGGGATGAPPDRGIALFIKVLAEDLNDK